MPVAYLLVALSMAYVLLVSASWELILELAIFVYTMRASGKYCHMRVVKLKIMPHSTQTRPQDEESRSRRVVKTIIASIIASLCASMFMLRKARCGTMMVGR